MPILDPINPIVILRCCRDWPCHLQMAYGTNGRCGLCRQVPDIINQPYVEPDFKGPRSSVG